MSGRLFILFMLKMCGKKCWVSLTLKSPLFYFLNGCMKIKKLSRVSSLRFPLVNYYKLLMFIQLTC